MNLDQKKGGQKTYSNVLITFHQFLTKNTGGHFRGFFSQFTFKIAQKWGVLN